MKLTEMSLNIIWSNSILMLAADKYFVLGIIRDVGIHRDDGSQGENFSS